MSATLNVAFHLPHNDGSEMKATVTYYRIHEKVGRSSFIISSNKRSYFFLVFLQGYAQSVLFRFDNDCCRSQGRRRFSPARYSRYRTLHVPNYYIYLPKIEIELIVSALYVCRAGWHFFPFNVCAVHIASAACTPVRAVSQASSVVVARSPEKAVLCYVFASLFVLTLGATQKMRGGSSSI